MATNLSIRDLYKARFSGSAAKTNDFSLGETSGYQPDTSVSSFLVDEVRGITGSATISGGLSETYELGFVNPGSNFDLLWNDQNFFWTTSGVVVSATTVTDLGLEDQVVQTVGTPPITYQITPGVFTEDSYTVNDRQVSYDFDINVSLVISSTPTYNASNSSTSGGVSVVLVGVEAGGAETNLGTVSLNTSSQPLQTSFSITNQNLSYSTNPSLYETYLIRLVTLGFGVTLVDDQSAIIQDYSWKMTATVDNDTLTLGANELTDNLITQLSYTNGQPVIVTAATSSTTYPITNRLYGRFEDGFNNEAIGYGNTFQKEVDIVEPPVTTPPTPPNITNLTYTFATETFTWDVASPAVGSEWNYKIEVHATSNYATLIDDDVTFGITQYNMNSFPGQLTAFTDYYFRVRSVDPNDINNFSSWFVFGPFQIDDQI